jgi:hypothetical protein
MFDTGRMRAPLGKPGQDMVRRLLYRQAHVPEASASLRDAQEKARPRPTLKAARRLPRRGTGSLF